MAPTVSIVVPVYKAEAYLPACLESILAQTFTDFELILVEDGSPNGCGELCDKLARTDGRIRVVHKPNGGPASAANAGLDAATGRYISYVDSDDLLEPDFLETLYKMVTESGCPLAACGAAMAVFSHTVTFTPGMVLRNSPHWPMACSWE